MRAYTYSGKPMHEVERDPETWSLLFRCRARGGVKEKYMCSVPNFCPVCAAAIDKNEIGVEDETTLHEQETIVPMTTDSAGQLVTEEPISLGYAYIEAGKPAALLPGYCNPPVVFLFWRWAQRHDIREWPPPPHPTIWTVWHDGSGNWRRVYREGWKPISAVSARLRVTQESDNE